MDFRTEAADAVRIELSGEESGSGYERTEEGILITSPGTYVLSGALEKGGVTVDVYEDEVVHLILDGVQIRYERTEEGILITSPGTYVLSGALEKGGVTVDVYEDEVVHLILDGVQIRADAGPAIYIAEAEKAVITAKEGTYNVLSDSAHRREGADACIFSEADLTLNGPAIYIAEAEKAVITAKEGTYNVLSDSAHRREGADACIFSEADLTLNGSGRLAVFGFHEHGIRSRDVVKAVGSPVYVKAKGDGIRGNNGVILYGSDVEVECEVTW